MEKIVFNSLVRDEVKKNGARATRRAGFIPGVLYGSGSKPIPIKLERDKAETILRHLESYNVIADLVLKKGSKKEKVKIVLKDIQMEPIKGNILHMDFCRIKMDEQIRMTVPVHLAGESPGEEQGGILEHEIREIELQALPDKMPDFIEVDISKLEIGDVILAQDIQLGEGIELVENPESTVLSIQAPRVSEEEEEEEGEEILPTGEESAEPKVISHEKAEERRREKEAES